MGRWGGGQLAWRLWLRKEEPKKVQSHLGVANHRSTKGHQLAFRFTLPKQLKDVHSTPIRFR